jgi:transporter family-2 protein
MVLSHFGWLGSPVQRVSPVHIIGAFVMIVGAYLATYTR